MKDVTVEVSSAKVTLLMTGQLLKLSSEKQHFLTKVVTVCLLLVRWRVYTCDRRVHNRVSAGTTSSTTIPALRPLQALQVQQQFQPCVPCHPEVTPAQRSCRLYYLKDVFLYMTYLEALSHWEHDHWEWESIVWKGIACNKRHCWWKA